MLNENKILGLEKLGQFIIDFFSKKDDKYNEKYYDYTKTFDKQNISIDYIQKIMKELGEKQNTYTIDQLKEVDVSSSLSDDVKAKLQLLYGDFIIIPVDKL